MENSTIEWTDHTFNPWIGCTKVSAGCANCYAEQLMGKRWNKVEWGSGGQRVRTSEANWRKPLTWNRKAKAAGVRQRVFCASLADVFEEKPDQPEMDEWRWHLLHLIALTPNLDWLLLTKRPENVGRSLAYAHGPEGHGWDDDLPPNVRIGTSVENQKQADERIPELLRIPAAGHFLSMEPLLGQVDISDWLGVRHGCRGEYPNEDCEQCAGQLRTVDWVIVGGESGPNARPMHPAWARSIRDQCQEACVPFFFKQWGAWCEKKDGDRYLIQDGSLHGLGLSTIDGRTMSPVRVKRVGKKRAGRLLDGHEWSEVPA